MNRFSETFYEPLSSSSNLIFRLLCSTLTYILPLFIIFLFSPGYPPTFICLFVYINMSVLCLSCLVCLCSCSQHLLSFNSFVPLTSREHFPSFHPRDSLVTLSLSLSFSLSFSQSPSPVPSAFSSLH